VLIMEVIQNTSVLTIFCEELLIREVATRVRAKQHSSFWHTPTTLHRVIPPEHHNYVLRKFVWNLFGLSTLYEYGDKSSPDVTVISTFMFFAPCIVI
jgi:hypothetical protein